jgi:hypothetical protein
MLEAKWQEVKPAVKHSLRVLDSNGDTKIEWDLDDPKSLQEAQEAFEKAKRTGQVFRAQPNGEGGGQMREFDPQADMIAVKTIVGG